MKQKKKLPRSATTWLRQTSLGRRLSKVAAVCRMPFSAWKGLREYRQNGRISHHIWEQLLWAHCASNGRTTSLLNIVTRTVRPPRQPTSVTGVLGHFDVVRQQEIVKILKRDGFYVFPERLSDVFCDHLQGLAAVAPAIIESNRDRHAPLEPYNPAHPVSRTYKITERDCLDNCGIQQLIADQSFVAIAESYLGTLPAIGGLDLWWSARYGNGPGSDAAQLFHFDFDAPPAWLKLFVYVTDVGPDNGPHVYVRGSHKAGLRQTAEFRGRGYERIDDKEIEATFGAGALVEISGPRGTVFMADTRGFHKGKFPTAGHRLVAQVIYCSPVFNDHGTPERLPQKVDPALAAALATTPHVYDRFQ